MRTHNPSYARLEYHTQLAKMSFDKIFDLAAGVYFLFCNIFHAALEVSFSEGQRLCKYLVGRFFYGRFLSLCVWAGVGDRCRYSVSCVKHTVYTTVLAVRRRGCSVHANTAVYTIRTSIHLIRKISHAVVVWITFLYLLPSHGRVGAESP